MRDYGYRVFMVLALVTSSSLVADGALAELPQKHFACEVQTARGIAGLVRVQARSREDAARAASQAEAFTLAGDRSPAIALSQCIEIGKERFSDSHFQAFVDSLAL